MRLLTVALLAMFSSLVNATPPGEGELISDGRDDCVKGRPTQYGGWTIHYKLINFSAMRKYSYKKNWPDSITVDPVWAAKNKADGDFSHFFMGSSWFGYAENKCQYVCNARKGCVSWTTVQSKDSTHEHGELYCFYYNAIISKDNLVKQPDSSPFKLYHAYNKLCDQKQEWGLKARWWKDY